MLSFLVLGDWGRRGTAAQRAVAAGMARASRRYDTSFIVSTGDNFYDHGVESVRDPHWVESFEAVYDAPTLYCPWYVALGNHDHEGSTRAQCQFSQYDARWHLPDRFYAINKRVCSDVHAQLIFLDTTPFSETAEEGARGTAYDPALQAYWLRHMLAPSRSRWRIVVGHHPVRSSSTFHGDTPGLRASIAPILQQFGVQAYLCGHEHDLQHLTEAGVHYVVSGAGSERRPTDTGPFTRFSRSSLGFAVVTLHADRMVLRFCDADATVLYEAEVPCAPAPKAPDEAPHSDGAASSVPPSDAVRPAS
jgi:DNA repair exonuclease SbcCD nuclease subunit